MQKIAVGLFVGNAIGCFMAMLGALALVNIFPDIPLPVHQWLTLIVIACAGSGACLLATYACIEPQKACTRVRAIIDECLHAEHVVLRVKILTAYVGLATTFPCIGTLALIQVWPMSGQQMAGMFGLVSVMMLAILLYYVPCGRFFCRDTNTLCEQLRDVVDVWDNDRIVGWIRSTIHRFFDTFCHDISCD